MIGMSYDIESFHLYFDHGDLWKSKYYEGYLHCKILECEISSPTIWKVWAIFMQTDYFTSGNQGLT